MNDLMALALVRKMLLELGYSLKPDASVDHVGALEIWLHQPLEEFDGRNPFQLLREPSGAEEIRSHLVKTLSSSRL